MLVKGYSGFSLRIPDFLRGASSCSFPRAIVWTAYFKLDTDVSPLFPYINATVEDSVYYENPNCIRFILDGYRCALYPKNAAASFFADRDQALRFVKRLIDFLNELHSRTDSIEPNHERFKPLPILQILKILPRTNCRECGFPACMAFAVALSKGDTVPGRCPGLDNPMNENAVYPVYDKSGNMVSTITIGIDTAEMRLDLEKQKEYIKSLEVSLSQIKGEQTRTLLEMDSSGADFGLTDREIEVLRLVAEGYTNIEISNLLRISPHTVKSHVIHIFNKLGVNDRTQAAVLATRYHLL